MTYQEYLQQHSLEESYVYESLGWRFSDKAIIIPVYSEDENLLFNKIRHLEGDAKFTYDPPKGNKASLYCIHKIKKYNKVVICEGEPDAARLWQAGIPAVTSTSGVATFNTSFVDQLKGHEVVIVFDTDKAGRDGLKNVASLLYAADIPASILFLPSGYKDVCEFFRSGKTVEDFWQCETVTVDDYLENNEPPEFKLITGEELMAKKLPPELWLIDRVLPYEGITMFAGSQATLKSFYTITLAQSLATGFSWLEKFPVNAKCNVLFIDKENSQRRTQQRMRNLGIDGRNMFWVEYPQFFQLNDGEDFSEIALSVARKVKKHNIQVIIIDSFTDVMVGNENASADTQKFFDAMRQLFPGRSILLLHHEKKAQGGFTSNTADKPRGSTNINAQIIVGFHTDIVRKEKQSYSLEQYKAGDSEKIKKFKVKINVEEDPDSIKSPRETMVTKLYWDGDIEDEDEKKAAARLYIEEVLSEKLEISRKELIDLCTEQGISKRSMSNVISDLKNEGYVESEKIRGKMNEVLYKWIEDPKKDDTIFL